MSIPRNELFYKTTLSQPLSNGGSETEVYVATLPTISSGYIIVNKGSEDFRELIKFTGTSTSPNRLTTCTRGLTFNFAAASAVSDSRVAANCKQHSSGEEVIIANGRYEQLIIDLLNGTSTIDATLVFNSNNITGVNSISGLATPTSGETTKAANIDYVNTVAIAGGADATTTIKGISKMSVAPASATSPIAVGDNDGRVPTQDENNALVGTSGSPSTTNKYVTNDDTATTGASKVIRSTSGSLVDPSLLALTTAGDTVYRGAANLTRVAIGAAGALNMVNAGATAPSWLALGTAGQVLTVNAGATAAEWAAGSLLTKDTANGGGTVTAGAETTLSTYTLPANTLGTGNVVVMKTFITWTGVANVGNAIFRFKYGGTTVLTKTITMDNTTDGYSGYLEFTLLGAGTTASQEGQCVVGYGISSAAAGAGSRQVISGGSGSATEDSTTALAMAITAQMAAGSDQTMTITSFYVQVIK